MWPDDFARYTDEFADDRIFLFEAARRGRPAATAARWSSCDG